MRPLVYLGGYLIGSHLIVKYSHRDKDNANQYNVYIYKALFHSVCKQDKTHIAIKQNEISEQPALSV